MKLFHRLLIVAAMALSACASVEEALPPDTGRGSNAPVTFNASVGAATKTAIDDERMVTWTEGDRITVFDSYGRSEEFTVTESCSEYSFTSNGIIGEGPYFAVAGYDTEGISFDKVNRQITFTRTTDAADGSFGAADIIASTTSGTSFVFHHVYAILKFSIATDDVSSLYFQADGISGEGDTVIGFDEDGSLVAGYDTGGNEAGIEGISGPGTYYLAVNPGEYEGFSILMRQGSALMKAESDKPFTASAGNMVNFGTLDVFIPETSVWHLVTNAGDLTAGDEIIIAASDYDNALGGFKGLTCTAVPISKSEDKGTLSEGPSDGIQRFTLTTGSASGRFGLYTGTGYLSGLSPNGLATQEGVYNWTISIGSSGIATIKGSSGNIRYNANSGGSFGFFPSSTQGNYKNVSIYKKVIVPQEGPQMSEVNAFLDMTDPGVYTYDSQSDIVEGVYTYREGTDQYALGDNSFRIQNLSEGRLAGIVLDRSGTAVWSDCDATITFYGITGHQEGISRKTFTVRKTEDGKIWLLEGNGTLGFIISTK